MFLDRIPSTEQYIYLCMKLSRERTLSSVFYQPYVGPRYWLLRISEALVLIFLFLRTPNWPGLYNYFGKKVHSFEARWNISLNPEDRWLDLERILQEQFLRKPPHLIPKVNFLVYMDSISILTFCAMVWNVTRALIRLSLKKWNSHSHCKMTYQLPNNVLMIKLCKLSFMPTLPSLPHPMQAIA